MTANLVMFVFVFVLCILHVCFTKSSLVKIQIHSGSAESCHLRPFPADRLRGDQAGREGGGAARAALGIRRAGQARSVPAAGMGHAGRSRPPGPLCGEGSGCSGPWSEVWAVRAGTGAFLPAGRRALTPTVDLEG